MAASHRAAVPKDDAGWAGYGWLVAKEFANWCRLPSQSAGLTMFCFAAEKFHRRGTRPSCISACDMPLWQFTRGSQNHL